MIHQQINKQEKEKDDTQHQKIEKGLQNDLINCNNHMHVWYPSTAALLLGDKLIQNILLSSSPSQWQVTTVRIHRVYKCMEFQLEYSSSEKNQPWCWQPRQNTLEVKEITKERDRKDQSSWSFWGQTEFWKFQAQDLEAPLKKYNFSIPNDQKDWLLLRKPLVELDRNWRVCFSLQNTKLAISAAKKLLRTTELLQLIKPTIDSSKSGGTSVIGINTRHPNWVDTCMF